MKSATDSVRSEMGHQEAAGRARCGIRGFNFHNQRREVANRNASTRTRAPHKYETVLFFKETQTVRRKRDEGDESVHKEEAAIEVANNSSGERPSSTTETQCCTINVRPFYSKI